MIVPLENISINAITGGCYCHTKNTRTPVKLNVEDIVDICEKECCKIPNAYYWEIKEHKRAVFKGFCRRHTIRKRYINPNTQDFLCQINHLQNLLEDT